MNLTNYNPQADKYIVFECISDPIQEMSGILSAFLLALVANYNFRINGLDKNHLAEVFSSKLPWWQTEWKDFGWKHGYWNLRDLNKQDILSLENETIRNKFYNSQVLHVYSNDDLIPFIYSNKNYIEAFELFEIQNSKQIYKELFQYLFETVEDSYIENIVFLRNEFEKYEKPIIIRVDENTILESITKIELGDFIYVFCDDENQYKNIKKQFPSMNFSRIKETVNVVDDPKTKIIGKLIEIYFLLDFDLIYDYVEDVPGKLLSNILSPK